ncbi:hypothetical protein R3W88_014732 [Solanum pinnatisectum]|uniref:NB-ARC domain-containing protein n=1 Tax=Solanum pinnatisectum TaxID=50273 RepID=A0AAV9KSJ9_9SOLN|nr:hypothetical protein R3W88_014732 [Solanum pinnatisectum]
MKITPIDLEVMNICYTNLKALTSAEVEGFLKKLRETSPHTLREYLIRAQNIHVMIEFLLIILTDVPKDFIHHEKSFDLLARVGALTREVSTLFRNLVEKSKNKESTDETSCATINLLENIELLKEDLKHVYLKAPDSSQCCFPMKIEHVKEDVEFIISFFVNIEQELYKDLWEHVLDVAYEAKDVIDSIIFRDNAKWTHTFQQLPIAIKKIKLIKEDVSHLLENAPKNRSLIIVNSHEKRVENKSLTSNKMIVFSSHFDIRAWCTVGQEYDEKKLVDKIFNQVIGSDSKLSENVDVADKIQKQLYGKRYLIILDDLWDTTTWDELTRPSPEVEKGSRIILTTREKKVALYGKCHSDLLNIILLRSEESWGLFEERVLGNKRCLDELLDVGKEIAQNCEGLPLVVDLIAEVIERKEKNKKLCG